MKYIWRIIKEFEKLPYKGYVQKMPKYEPIDSYFYPTIQIDKFMMISDALNFHIDTIRTEMTGTQQIMILHVCDLYESESKYFFADKNLLQVFSTSNSESEIVIESKSQSVHKSINMENYEIDETEHEEPSVTYNPVIK